MSTFDRDSKNPNILVRVKDLEEALLLALGNYAGVELDEPTRVAGMMAIERIFRRATLRNPNLKKVLQVIDGGKTQSTKKKKSKAKKTTKKTTKKLKPEGK